MRLKDLKKSEVPTSQNIQKNKKSESLDFEFNMNKKPQKNSDHRFEKDNSAIGNSIKNSNSSTNFLNRIFSFFARHKILSVIILIVIILSGYTQYKISSLRKSGLDVGFFDIFNIGKNVFSSGGGDALKRLNKTNDRTNILILGIDKRDYDSSLLTDSIMLMSYDHKTNQIAQISFPRDLFVKYKIGDYEYNTKINEVFSNSFYSGGKNTIKEKYNLGFENLGSVLEQITGLKLHYGMTVDFNGFKDIVNAVGGVTIDVENTFTDYLYPVETDDGYVEGGVHFEKGIQTMDGDTALRFARSRKAEGIEGTDFARAKRQQKVIQAIKEKFISSDLIRKFSSIDSLTNIIGNNVQFYDVGADELNNFIEARESLKDIKFFSFVVDLNFGSYSQQLMVQDYWADLSGAYAIKPQGGNYDQVRELAQMYLNNSYLLVEDAKIKIIYTNQNRYNDYLEMKDIFIKQKLKYDYSDQLFTLTDSTSGTAKLYVLKDGLDQSVEFYKNLMKKNNISLEIITKDKVPEDLLKLSEENNLFLVLN